MPALIGRWRDDLSPDWLQQAVQSGYERAGLEKLKPEQKDAVQTLNMFITLPTGYGKSAIFQVLLFVLWLLLSLLHLPSSSDSFLPLVLVISPLVSLMSDQVTKLRQLGIRVLW